MRNRIVNALQDVESSLARLLGKGWGAATVAKEFQQAISLMKNDQPKLFIDIGGNKGLYTKEILRRFPGAEVVVFEPSLTNLAVLNKMFSEANVTVVGSAVSNVAGQAELYSDEPGSGLASLTKRDLDYMGISFEAKETVSTVRFESYWQDVLNKRPIDFVKLDIEGHEMDALSGFGEALHHVGALQFEFGGCNLDTRTYFRDFWKFLEPAGFRLFRISPLGPVRLQKYSETMENFTVTNYLAIRQS